MIAATQNPRIERGHIDLYVPSSEGELCFSYPSAGPGCYGPVGNHILQNKLLLPNGPNRTLLVEQKLNLQTTSL